MQITIEAPVMTQQSNISDSIQDRIARIERLTKWLDSSLPVPGLGITIGWDTIIGLLPGVGDLATTAISGWIINEARQLGVSRFTLARMIANTSIDAIVGSIPVAGDLFDAAYKANVKNLRLLKNSLQRQGRFNPDEKVASVKVVNQQP